jgi:hypothetical protein
LGRLVAESQGLRALSGIEGHKGHDIDDSKSGVHAVVELSIEGVNDIAQHPLNVEQ